MAANKTLLALALVLVLGSAAHAGMTKTRTLAGIVDGFDTETITVLNQKLHKRWKIKKSALKPNSDVRPGQSVVLQVTPDQFIETAMPRE